MPDPVSATILPDWLLYVQALGPTLIALAVAYVAFRQWRTAEASRKIANDKLVLDLFDRRFAWYSAVKEHLFKPLNPDSQSSADNAFTAFYRLLEEAHFLFGPEVQERLRPISESAMELSMIGHTLGRDQNRESKRQQELRRYTPLASALREDLPSLLAPYMKMDQKL